MRLGACNPEMKRKKQIKRKSGNPGLLQVFRSCFHECAGVLSLGPALAGWGKLALFDFLDFGVHHIVVGRWLGLGMLSA